MFFFFFFFIGSKKGRSKRADAEPNMLRNERMTLSDLVLIKFKILFVEVQGHPQGYDRIKDFKKSERENERKEKNIEREREDERKAKTFSVAEQYGLTTDNATFSDFDL